MPAQKPIVLLVDDDETIVYGLTRTLRRQPFQLYAARSAAEAMTIFSTCDVDVVVADEPVGEISGRELLAWAEANYPETVRVALSGRADQEHASNQEGSPHLVLLKPCSAARLAYTIRAAIEHRSRLREAQPHPEMTESVA